MRPALNVHPSWLGAEAAGASDTWRWFYLERWLNRPGVAGMTPVVFPSLDPAAPSDYASILQTALWLVAEALYRDGISREQLSADHMRWARRLGLALLGDGPVTVTDGPGRSMGAERGRVAEESASSLVDLFPAADRAILRLSLPAPVQSAGSTGIRESAAGGLGASAKTSMLVRLAKRHAAASYGVDLRAAPPTRPAALAVEFDPVKLCESDGMTSACPPSGDSPSMYAEAVEELVEPTLAEEGRNVS